MAAELTSSRDRGQLEAQRCGRIAQCHVEGGERKRATLREPQVGGVIGGQPEPVGQAQRAGPGVPVGVRADRDIEQIGVR